MRTQTIVEEVLPPPVWVKPALAASLCLLAVSLGGWAYLSNYDLPQTQKEIVATTGLITDGNRKLVDLKKLRQENDVLERRKQVLDRLVGGGKHWSGYLEAVRDNTPKGMQINQLSLNDNELKLEGAALNFSTVSNLSINLGASNLLNDANIEYVVRPEKRPDLVNFCVLSKLAQDALKPAAGPNSNTTEKPHTASASRSSSLLSAEAIEATQ